MGQFFFVRHGQTRSCAAILIEVNMKTRRSVLNERGAGSSYILYFLSPGAYCSHAHRGASGFSARTQIGYAPMWQGAIVRNAK